ncbi:MAG: hypothetical protein H6730_31115 [Deltaproteobacteria bacterium]|nr:hypothetical protein [Deltaproteobacteria bacterium]
MRATTTAIAGLTGDQQRRFSAYCVKLTYPMFHAIASYADEEPKELISLVSGLVDELWEGKPVRRSDGSDRLTVVKAMLQLLPHADDAAYPEYYQSCFLNVLVGAVVAATHDPKDGAISALSETINLIEAALSYVHAEEANAAIDELFGRLDAFLEEEVGDRARLELNLARSAVPGMAPKLREKLWATDPRT